MPRSVLIVLIDSCPLDSIILVVEPRRSVVAFVPLLAVPATLFVDPLFADVVSTRYGVGRNVLDIYGNAHRHPNGNEKQPSKHRQPEKCAHE
jgi:hypothetical protein